MIILLMIGQMYCISQVLDGIIKENKFRIMFYNVENFFDYDTDSTISYNEFTPQGQRKWTKSKFIKKRNNIYKVIKAVGEWEPVTIIGLCEIENEFVIDDLLNNTPLKKHGYNYVHYNSNDHRGIDVCLLYREKVFNVIKHDVLKVESEDHRDFVTRDILYVVGRIGEDTLHIFVNHWTSRYRGLVESQKFRHFASDKLRHFTDSLCISNNKPNIIFMGDFNDNPHDESIVRLEALSQCAMINLRLEAKNKYVLGTMKYKQGWHKFDQFFVSQTLLDSGHIYTIPIANIYDERFLLVEDDTYLGFKPHRTYIGYSYKGGFSDHLPVYIDLIISEH